MSLLLDTNILVYLIRASNLELLDRKINPNREKVYISIASVGEVKAMSDASVKPDSRICLN